MCSVLPNSFHGFSNIESLKSWLSVAFARKKNTSKVISVNSLSRSEPTLGALRLHGLSTKRAMAASVEKNPMCWKFLKKIHESSLNHSPSFTAVKMLRFCRKFLCLVATCPWCSANHQDTLMIQVSIASKYTHAEHAKTGETTCTFQIQHTLETTNHTNKHFSFHRNIAILSPHKFNFKMVSVSFIPKRKHECMVGQHHRTITLHHSTPCPLLSETTWAVLW